MNIETDSEILKKRLAKVNKLIDNNYKILKREREKNNLSFDDNMKLVYMINLSLEESFDILNEIGLHEVTLTLKKIYILLEMIIKKNFDIISEKMNKNNSYFVDTSLRGGNIIKLDDFKFIDKNDSVNEIDFSLHLEEIDEKKPENIKNQSIFIKTINHRSKKNHQKAEMEKKVLYLEELKKDKKNGLQDQNYLDKEIKKRAKDLYKKIKKGEKINFKNINNPFVILNLNKMINEDMSKDNEECHQNLEEWLEKTKRLTLNIDDNNLKDCLNNLLNKYNKNIKEADKENDKSNYYNNYNQNLKIDFDNLENFIKKKFGDGYNVLYEKLFEYLYRQKKFCFSEVGIQTENDDKKYIIDNKKLKKTIEDLNFKLDQIKKEKLQLINENDMNKLNIEKLNQKNEELKNMNFKNNTLKRKKKKYIHELKVLFKNEKKDTYDRKNVFFSLLQQIKEFERNPEKLLTTEEREEDENNKNISEEKLLINLKNRLNIFLKNKKKSLIEIDKKKQNYKNDDKREFGIFKFFILYYQNKNKNFSNLKNQINLKKLISDINPNMKKNKKVKTNSFSIIKKNSYITMKKNISEEKKLPLLKNIKNKFNSNINLTNNQIEKNNNRKFSFTNDLKNSFLKKNELKNKEEKIEIDLIKNESPKKIVKNNNEDNFLKIDKNTLNNKKNSLIRYRKRQENFLTKIDEIQKSMFKGTSLTQTENIKKNKNRNKKIDTKIDLMKSNNNISGKIESIIFEKNNQQFKKNLDNNFKNIIQRITEEEPLKSESNETKQESFYKKEKNKLKNQNNNNFENREKEFILEKCKNEQNHQKEKNNDKKELLNKIRNFYDSQDFVIKNFSKEDLEFQKAKELLYSQSNFHSPSHLSSKSSKFNKKNNISDNFFFSEQKTKSKFFNPFFINKKVAITNLNELVFKNNEIFKPVFKIKSRKEPKHIEKIFPLTNLNKILKKKEKNNLKKNDIGFEEKLFKRFFGDSKDIKRNKKSSLLNINNINCVNSDQEDSLKVNYTSKSEKIDNKEEYSKNLSYLSHLTKKSFNQSSFSQNNKNEIDIKNRKSNVVKSKWKFLSNQMKNNPLASIMINKTTRKKRIEDELLKTRNKNVSVEKNYFYKKILDNIYSTKFIAKNENENKKKEVLRDVILISKSKKLKLNRRSLIKLIQSKFLIQRNSLIMALIIRLVNLFYENHFKCIPFCKHLDQFYFYINKFIFWKINNKLNFEKINFSKLEMDQKLIVLNK